MQPLHGSLARLVSRLDELGPNPSLTQLASALETADLTAPDISEYVRETPQSYHRASVVQRDHYEVLVLTWMPGQGSVPHDHAGSVSAMLVVQGTANEGSWRIAEDGYADLDFESQVGAGELTAWQDAGVHTVRNAAANGPPLITVHVYAPPLKDFRRYIFRPQAIASRPAESIEKAPVIVVVGGGFSGTITAAQLLRKSADAGVDTEVVLVERQGAVGEGLAYGTRDSWHLLNVAAGRMSVWPDRPDDFVEWCSRRYRPVAKGEFLPRMWYGEYVRESLLATANQTADRSRLRVMFDEVRRLLRRADGGWNVYFGRSASTLAAAVVLAIGHRPPADPLGQLWSGPRNRFIADPWQAFATNAIAPGDEVVVLGTGLTAVDAALSLSRDRRAPITLISRRGLLPLPHSSEPAPPVNLGPLVAELTSAPDGLSAKSLCRRLRQTAAELAKTGHDWRSVVDGVRPHTSLLWKALPREERRRFLSKLRPFWEVHRHRMAVDVAKRFQSLRNDRLVKIVTGTIVAAQSNEDCVRLFVRDRGDDRLREVRAQWVVNCTGPSASNSADSNPAIGSLLVHGWARPDLLSLGLETTAGGEVVDSHGEITPNLCVVGTLRKPELWESTAVPELRMQAAAVAETLVNKLRALKGIGGDL